MDFKRIAKLKEKTESERNSICAVFTLAGEKIEKIFDLENQYWPNHPEYYEARSPWYLMKTRFGFVTVGWRKNVLEINWEETKLRKVVTEDNVTKSETHVHAWSYKDALSYLTTLFKGEAP